MGDHPCNQLLMFAPAPSTIEVGRLGRLAWLLLSLLTVHCLIRWKWWVAMQIEIIERGGGDSSYNRVVSFPRWWWSWLDGHIEGGELSWAQSRKEKGKERRKQSMACKAWTQIMHAREQHKKSHEFCLFCGLILIMNWLINLVFINKTALQWVPTVDYLFAC